MAYLNVKERVIEAKVVYYGAGLSGKTTNLEQIKKMSGEGKCGEMMSLETDGDRTLFFDWLPFNIGKFNGCDVKMQLYTVPGQQKYAETRKKVLSSADGVVLVLDSQSGALERNKQIILDLREHMAANGLSLSRVPVVVQLNKRDLPTAMSPEELTAAIGIADWPRVEAIAAKGEGVFETLREATRRVLTVLREEAKSNEIRIGESSGLDGQTLYASLTEPAVVTAGDASHAPAPRAVAESAPAVSRANGTPKAVPMPARTGTAAAPVNGAAHAADVVAGQRALTRRLDALEIAMQQQLAAAVADLERRLLTRLGEVIERSVSNIVEPRASETMSAISESREGVKALDAHLVSLTRHVARLDDPGIRRAQVEAITDAMKAPLADVRAAVASSVNAFDLSSASIEKRVEAAGLDASRRIDAMGRVIEKAVASVQERVQSTHEVVSSVAALVPSLQASIASLSKESASSRAQVDQSLDRKLGDQTMKFQRALGDVWERAHDQLSLVEVGVRESQEVLAAVQEELKTSRKGWFR